MLSKQIYYEECLLLGDLNLVENITIDRSSRAGREYCLKNFRIIKTKIRLFDIYRHKKPLHRDYSHFSGVFKTSSFG